MPGDSALLDVIVLGLTLYALTYLLRYTDGPFDVFMRFRMGCGIRYTPELDGQGQQVHIIEDIPDDKWLAKLVGCWWCLSVWISIMIGMFWNDHVSYGQWIYYIFAPVGLAGFLHQWHE